jgi:hypothetical protein
VLPSQAKSPRATGAGLDLAPVGPRSPSGCPFARALPATVVAGTALALTRRASGPPLQGERAADPSGVAPSNWSGVGFGVGRAAGPEGLPFARALPAAVVAGTALALTRRAPGLPLQGKRAAESSEVVPRNWSGVGLGASRAEGPKGLSFARALPAVVVAGAALAPIRRASGPLL